ncbi:HdeD family acid-resistance protein [Erwinia sp. V71]|uniref:HdeD family acid-resistance protein n=1 Tax=Erwinia sp. V71 TaxID=3369424 RepID=UPI003F61FA80
MIRLIFLLVGAHVLKSRWVLMALFGLCWVIVGAAVLCDIAADGRLSVPLDVLALLLIVEGVVEIAAALIMDIRVYWPGVWKGGSFLLIAFLVFDLPWDNNIFASLLFGLVFLGDGLFRIASAAVLRTVKWRREVIVGVTEIALSMLIFSNWPFHHHITVPLCFSLLLLSSGVSLILMARQILLLPENTSVMSLPLFTRRGLRRWHGANYLHPPFPPQRQLLALTVFVWTPLGSATVIERRRVIDRYIAAVDHNGVISTGHISLQLLPDLYISQYPQEDIDRDSRDFRAMLRSGEENDMAGRFLHSLEEEIADWCAPDQQVQFTRYNAQALHHFWQMYSADNTYNLTSRNCSSTVIQALDVAIEGAMGHLFLPAVRLFFDPNFWLLGLVRGRAEEMTWTPGLALDYVRLLKAVVEPGYSRAWHKRLQNALAMRRIVLKRAAKPPTEDSASER